ncbi:MAG: hypothetical protein WD036_10250 [Bauldia sp.]
MIILTAAEADKVRGLSPTDPTAAIEPVPLKPAPGSDPGDGTFLLSEQVLVDPAHADVRHFLAALPTAADIDAALKFDPGAKPEDQAALDALALPTWKDAGVRKAP